jgi:hypothetical protein
MEFETSLDHIAFKGSAGPRNPPLSGLQSPVVPARFSGGPIEAAGELKPIALDEVVRQLAHSVRVALRDFCAEHMKPHSPIGFVQQSHTSPDLAPVTKIIGAAVRDLETIYEDLSDGGMQTVPARALVLNVKMPLKVFMLDMAGMRDHSSIAQGELHAVVLRCLELEQEMSAKLLQIDMAVAGSRPE